MITPRTLRCWRRLSQWLFFLLFAFLFIRTDYSGSDQLEYAVNLLFRLDPLLAVSVQLAARTFLALLWPSLLLVGLSLVAGRSFCGWLCPMGGLLDACQPLAGRRTRPVATRFPGLRRPLLLVLLIAALFGLPLAGLLDPFSLLVRGLALAWYPALDRGAELFFTLTYEQGPALIQGVTEPLYAFLRWSVLPFAPKWHELLWLSALLLFLPLALEWWQRRFFCRNLCPLGALLGWLSGFGLLRVQGGDDSCGRCRICRELCRMGAVDEGRGIDMDQCTLCLDCVVACPRQIISFSWLGEAKKVGVIRPGRRRLLAALAAGVTLPLLDSVDGAARSGSARLLRPPGALEGSAFYARCLRCGECMKVCIGNGLQPLHFQAGLSGFYTPHLETRGGYCELNCTLCGQVCPTGAIQELSLAQKLETRIGIAVLDRNRCLPIARGIPCIVCEEHCPTADKAITFREQDVLDDQGRLVRVRQPYVVEALCVGCGICEHRCPLAGESAIRVLPHGRGQVG